MPYSRTQARIDALARIRALRTPFIYVKVRTRKVPTVVRDSVFQNCVFQLSAILEDYLLQVISGWFSRLIVLGAANSCIPVNTRAVAILRSQANSLRGYIATRDEVKFAEVLVRERDILSLMTEAARIPAVDLEDLIVKDRKFPSPRNVEALFRRLGIEKIHGRISTRTKSSFELNLRSFMDVRNALAHESPPSITDIDVDRYFEQVGTWIAAIDKEFYVHVNRISGSAYWCSASVLS